MHSSSYLLSPSSSYSIRITALTTRVTNAFQRRVAVQISLSQPLAEPIGREADRFCSAIDLRYARPASCSGTRSAR